MSTTANIPNPSAEDCAIPVSGHDALPDDGVSKTPGTRKASPCIISESSVGTELDEGECQVLAQIMGVSTLQDGDLLVREGEEDNSLFILASGRLAVAHGRARDRETVVYRMSPGECAGTRAFVDRTGRKATLRAMGDVTVYALQPERFEALLQTNALLVYKVMRALFRTTHSNLMRMNMESRELTNYFTKSRGRY